MTPAFSKFMEQFRSTGSDKAQGYDESHFVGLSEEEKIIVFSCLERELTAPGVIGWLFLLDENKAQSALQDYLNSNHKPFSGLHRILIGLYVYSKDERFLDDFEYYFSQFYEWERDEAVQLYASYVQSEQRKSKFFKKVILDEKDPDALSSAADFYLRLVGIPVGAPDERAHFFRVRKLLESRDVNEKREGFRLVGAL